MLAKVRGAGYPAHSHTPQKDYLMVQIKLANIIVHDHGELQS
jgi:hypothetical protein